MDEKKWLIKSTTDTRIPEERRKRAPEPIQHGEKPIKEEIVPEKPEKSSKP